MNIYTATDRTPELLETLLAVWEASVRATHDFLAEKDILDIRPQVFLGLRNIETLLVAADARGRACGFMGVEAGIIEMLFIAPATRGQGLGKRLVNTAVDQLSANRVDVNEQNVQGLEFYLHMGFVVVERSSRDAQGNPFPILHLQKA